MRKLDYYKYTASPRTNKLRPALTGVFHDNGMKVASDAQILVAVKESYPEEFEGKIVGKNGEYVEGKYPKYNLIRPGKGDLRRNYIGVDRDGSFTIEAVHKVDGENVETVDIMQSRFNKKLFEKLCKAMDRIGTNVIYVSRNPLMPCFAEGPDGWAMLMPIVKA